MKGARRTRQKNPRADRAHWKADTVNGTAVNKDERLKFRVKKGNGKSPDEQCVQI